MTQSFEEFLAERGYMLGYNHDYQVAFNYGAQSRQGEIDAINALNEMSEQKIDDLVLRNIELQKRIDDALEILSKMKHNGAYRAIDILKGESNE